MFLHQAYLQFAFSMADYHMSTHIMYDLWAWEIYILGGEKSNRWINARIFYSENKEADIAAVSPDWTYRL